MGDESSTAQVHPQKLSQALIEAAQQRGAQLRIGEVQNITTSAKKVTGALLPPLTGVLPVGQSGEHDVYCFLMVVAQVYCAACAI